MIINRTPHEIVIGAGRTRRVLPAEHVARVEVIAELGDRPSVIDGVPIRSMKWGAIVGLPAPRSGVYHVVSVVVAAAACCNGRGAADLLVPGEQVRDAAGRIIGARCLAWADSSLPGLADE